MDFVSTNGKERFRAALISLKLYAVLAPLILVALIRGAGLAGDVAVHLLAICYVITFLVLLLVGIGQLSAGLRKLAYSSFVFAGVALLWILVLLLLLPSLASP